METQRPKGTSNSPVKSVQAVEPAAQQDATGQAVPYPEYSILEDGYTAKFKQQILGQPGRDLLYDGWIKISLETCPGSDVPLDSLFDHLHTSLTPPPGIPLLKDSAELTTHLSQYQVVEIPVNHDGNHPVAVKSPPSETSTLVVKDATLRQPTFEETSEVWKSVGISLLRWALVAMSKAGSSIPAPTIVTSASENGVVHERTETAGPSSFPARQDGPSTSISRDSEDAATISGRDNGLPDSAFTVPQSSLLPYPELSLRRSFAVTETEKMSTPTPSTLESATAMVEMEIKEAGKNKKKAFWASQPLGVQGSTAVAMAWIRAATVENPGENHYTTIESAYHLYRAYGYHPFQCPPLDEPTFTRLVVDGSSSGSREGWPGKAWYNVTDESGLAGQPAPQAGSSKHANKLPTLMRLTLKSPESMLVKEHESIWESVGMGWKKARVYEWKESKLVEAREKEAAAKAAKGEEKRRRVLKNVNRQPEVTEAAPDRRSKNQATNRPTTRCEVDPPGPRPSGNVSGPNPLQRMEMHVPRRPDFVMKWFNNTFRRAPPAAQLAQRDMWQAYSALVQTHSARYERDLARFFAIRQGLVDRKEFEILRLEGERLSEVHRMLDYYVALKPAELFQIVIHRFGCTLGRGPGGEYTLDGLEAIPILHFV